MARLTTDFSRRRMLKAGVGAATLFTSAPYALVWAQSEGTLKLLRAPKIALVIGNSNYNRSPLRNPANDARAIAETLKATGFDVTVKLDAMRDELATAVQEYTRLLAKHKGVGLFYFAGHGLQLAWRNYMIPVDADIRSTADIQKQGVEVGVLLEGIGKAANPLNVIVLDACRDNPFDSLGVMDQKGLSQMDAPPSTLLAYATAPGNVASDGEGVNGLYTENLLREIIVPEARIEDVFKRVRLNVRRRTNGRQIPWESTSLEEDFYFIPPKQLKKISTEMDAREFEAELMEWEKIKSTNTPEPLEDYLRRYPSGRFAELAHSRLDQVLSQQGESKVQVLSSAENPYSKGTAVASTNRKVGDRYTYREIDIYTRIVNRTFTKTIAEITDTEVIYRGGGRTDLLGNPLRTSYGAPSTGSQIFGVEYSVGKRWTSRHRTVSRNGIPVQVELAVRVITREKITVPAGTFDAFLVEAHGYARGSSVNSSHTSKRWMVPDQVRDHIALEVMERAAQGKVVASFRQELMSFQQS